MNKEYVFFQWSTSEGKRDYAYIIMNEAIRKRRVKVYTGPECIRKKKIAEIHSNICEKHPLFAKIWYRIYLAEMRLYKEKKYVFLFNEWHPAMENLGFIKWLKVKYDAQIVLVLRNMILNKKYPAVRNVPLQDLKSIFDLVVTDEKKDADLYQLYFAPDPFSVLTKKRAKIKFDICFAGTDKGRAQIISCIAEKAKVNGVVYDFRIMENKRKYSNLKYVEYQPYVEIIKQDMSSNCILEVLQPGQDSFTLRLQEAVCLGKKLLTNNEKVKEEKYYNPQYIQVFNDINDIDWNFVTQRIDVNYGYQGEYSPVAFLKNIGQELERNNQNHD